MKSKLEQYNQSYKKAVSGAIYKLMPNVAQFTITNVLIDPSLKNGRVWIRTSAEGFKLINDKRAEIQGKLKLFVKTRYTPKLTFIVDDQYLDHLDELFSKVEQEETQDKN